QSEFLRTFPSRGFQMFLARLPLLDIRFSDERAQALGQRTQIPDERTSLDLANSQRERESNGRDALPHGRVKLRLRSVVQSQSAADIAQTNAAQANTCACCRQY